MRNISVKSCRENQNTYFIFKNIFSKNHTVEKYNRPRQATDKNTIQCMHFSCWIHKATGTHSEYVLLIAVPQQQWLHEHASISHYIYIAWLVVNYI
jgi:hypothetical protein